MQLMKKEEEQEKLKQRISDEKEKKQLDEPQRKTKEAISAVEKGTTIQTESAVDSSV